MTSSDLLRVRGKRHSLGNSYHLLDVIDLPRLVEVGLGLSLVLPCWFASHSRN